MRQVNAQLSDSDHTRLLKLKESDGFKDRDWADWFRFKALAMPLSDSVDESINKSTARLLDLWLVNLGRNLTYWHASHDKNMLDVLNGLPLKNLRDARELLPEHLREIPLDKVVPTGPCIVIGRGPSLFKRKHLELLANWKFKNPPTIIVTDGALLDCLRAGVIPEKFPNFISQSIDGNRSLIVRWYGDPDFKEHSPKATPTEIAANAQDIQLINHYGSNLKVLVGSTVSPNVIKRCLQSGAEVYVFHPLFDSLGHESMTRVMMYVTQTDTTPPLLTAACGGNAGTTAFVLSWNLLRCSPILLIGMDFGYLPETPLEQTAYASKALEQGDLVGASHSLVEVKNPNDGVTYKTDAVFMHYRQSLFDMLDESPPPSWVKIYNNTEGGIIFGHKTIEWKSFREALQEIS